MYLWCTRYKKGLQGCFLWQSLEDWSKVEGQGRGSAFAQLEPWPIATGWLGVCALFVAVEVNVVSKTSIERDDYRYFIQLATCCVDGRDWG
jgi:hypothetical protein